MNNYFPSFLFFWPHLMFCGILAPRPLAVKAPSLNHWTAREIPPRKYFKNCCCCLIAKSFLILCNPMDCSSPGPSVRGTCQARILEWVAISFSRRSSQPRDQIHISCLAGRFFTTTPPGKPQFKKLT